MRFSSGVVHFTGADPWGSTRRHPNAPFPVGPPKGKKKKVSRAPSVPPASSPASTPPVGTLSSGPEDGDEDDRDGEARAALADKVKHWDALSLQYAAEVAEELHLPIEDVKRALRNPFNAAANDIAALASRINDELHLAERRTGCRGFAVLTASHSDLDIGAHIVGTDASLKYFPEMQHMDGAAFANKYRTWATAERVVRAGPVPTDPTKRRSEVVAMIEQGLQEKTGNNKVRMNYVAYERLVMGELGWELLGWPENVPMGAPSKMGSGGAAAIWTLWERLSSGTCRWERVSEERRAQIREKYKAYKKKGRVGGKVKEEEGDADEGDDEEEEEQETSTPKKRRRAREEQDEDEPTNPKKRRRAREEEGQEGDDDEDPAPKKLRRARDEDEEEDEDDVQPPTPKKRRRAREEDDEDESDDTPAPPVKNKVANKGKGKWKEKSAGDKGKGKTDANVKVTKRKHLEDDDEDEDDEEDDPPAKNAKTKPASGMRYSHSRKRELEPEDSDDDSERIPRRGRRRRACCLKLYMGHNAQMRVSALGHATPPSEVRPDAVFVDVPSASPALPMVLLCLCLGSAADSTTVEAGSCASRACSESDALFDAPVVFKVVSRMDAALINPRRLGQQRRASRECARCTCSAHRGTNSKAQVRRREERPCNFATCVRETREADTITIIYVLRETPDATLLRLEDGLSVA
ncbi:hypothetical protein C8R45DRAFT_1158709 [Mycena sanguinolenta]|nr:hypothetical protein C8R45DRAFT_1158709 [Mycena sanguinolenta]